MVRLHLVRAVPGGFGKEEIFYVTNLDRRDLEEYFLQRGVGDIQPLRNRRVVTEGSIGYPQREVDKTFLYCEHSRGKPKDIRRCPEGSLRIGYSVEIHLIDLGDVPEESVRVLARLSPHDVMT